MNFWDEKYRDSEYIYGTHPNAFFREELIKIPPGILLLPAEGEGRNALFALENNWNIKAIDSSMEAQKKALKLCHNYTSRLNYEVHNLEEFNYPQEKYDAIALIYAHFGSDVRAKIHSRIISSLTQLAAEIVKTDKILLKNQPFLSKNVFLQHCIFVIN